MSASVTVDLAVDAQAALGESPLWDTVAHRLVWVDIDGHSVHFLDPGSGVREDVAVDQPVTAIVPRAAGGFVLAVRDGFAMLDSPSDTPRLMTSVDHGAPDIRMNDGKCDSQGRFWAGSMSVHLTPNAGRLYRLDVDGSVTRVLDDVTISNGLGWSADGETMYFVDTPTMGIDTFGYDPDTGNLGGRRRLVTIPQSAGGRPDGLAVDAEGGIWVAIAHGWAVHRYTADGRFDRRIPLPVSQVTSCAFGGAELDELYITTARGALSDAQRHEQPHAGGVFACRPGVTGRAAEPYRG